MIACGGLQNKMEKKIEQDITQNNIQFVRLDVVDINGVSKGYLCDSDFFKDQIQYKGFVAPACTFGGFNVVGEIVDSTGLCSSVNFENGIIYPDLETLTRCPSFQDTACVFADFDFPKDRNLNGVCCRSACKKQLEKLKNMGYRLYSATEYEFYIADKDTLLPIYKDTHMNAHEVHKKVLPVVKGCRPEVYQAEYGPGQQEISVIPEFGITGINNAFRYKNVVKDTCRSHGFEALFLSKPYMGKSGSSAQFNHSLWDLYKEKNVFWDERKADNFSDICRHWVGGLQEHSKALTALSCQTFNCYERLVPKTFAPTDNSWGIENRTVCFRMKNQSEKGTYVESRIPGAGSNPYLVALGCLIAGIDGIERKLEPKSKLCGEYLYSVKELPEGVECLPKSLEEALNCLQEDEVFIRELGDAFMKAFVALKKDEIEKGKASNKLENDEEKWVWYRSFYHPFI